MTSLANPPGLAPAENPPTTATKFRTGQVATITSTHFLHDLFSAFLAPTLPLLIEKLSLTYIQAGSLTALLQFPSLLNPHIGYLDDKLNLRMLVIFAPAITDKAAGLPGAAQKGPPPVGGVLLPGLAATSQLVVPVRAYFKSSST